MIADYLSAYAGTSVARLCSSLSVNRAWYYARPPVAESCEKDILLRDEIENVAEKYPFYGYRRVTEELKRAGWVINHKHVLRIMRDESLLFQLRRRFVCTTDSEHSNPIYINRIKNGTN